MNPIFNIYMYFRLEVLIDYTMINKEWLLFNGRFSNMNLLIKDLVASHLIIYYIQKLFLNFMFVTMCCGPLRRFTWNCFSSYSPPCQFWQNYLPSIHFISNTRPWEKKARQGGGLFMACVWVCLLLKSLCVDREILWKFELEKFGRSCGWMALWLLMIFCKILSTGELRARAGVHLTTLKDVDQGVGLAKQSRSTLAWRTSCWPPGSLYYICQIHIICIKCNIRN